MYSEKEKPASHIEFRFKIWTPRFFTCAAVFSMLLSLSFVLGGKINIHAAVPFEAFQLLDLFHWVLFCAIVFVIVVPLLFLICRYAASPEVKQHGKKTWLLASGIIFLCWLPYFLIFYPGNLSNDSFSTLYQLSGAAPLSNHHPIMFTLFVGAVYKVGLLFGNREVGVACYSIVQMLLLASILGFNIYWFAKKGVHRFVLLLITLFFSLNPVIAMYAITMWKDVLFGGWLLLLVMFLFDAVQSGGALLISKKGMRGLAVLSFLVAFGRNNGIYIMLAVFVVLLVVYKMYFKKLLPLFTVVLVVIQVIQGPLYSALHINRSEFAESIAIPLQQIGYTEKYGGQITPEQEEFLYLLMPRETMEAAYAPYTADSIKFNTAFDNGFLEENKTAFFKVWLQVLTKNVTPYVKAYLMETLGYYHIGTTDWLCQFGVAENKEGYVGSNLLDGITRVDLRRSIESGIDSNRGLYSIALMVWLCFLVIFAFIIKGRAKYIVALLPLVALWATIMIAAPFYCEFRYMFSFLLSVPFILFSLITKPPIPAGDKKTV